LTTDFAQQKSRGFRQLRHAEFPTHCSARLAEQTANLGHRFRGALDKLNAAHFLRSRESAAGAPEREQLEIYHHRLLETVLGMLSPAGRRELHRRFAATLERSGAEQQRLAQQRANPVTVARSYAYAGYTAHFLGDVTEAAERLQTSLTELGPWLENVDYLTAVADLSWNMLMRG